LELQQGWVKGVTKMMHSNLRQTTFHMELLVNAVNQGRCSAYQICATPGKQLGQIGTIVGFASETPANEADFPTESAGGTLEQQPSNWFKKTLFALKS
jgi:hypothetical protein